MLSPLSPLSSFIFQVASTGQVGVEDAVPMPEKRDQCEVQSGVTSLAALGGGKVVVGCVDGSVRHTNPPTLHALGGKGQRWCARGGCTCVDTCQYLSRLQPVVRYLLSTCANSQR